MSIKTFISFLAGMMMGAISVSIVQKIYIDNLHHVACQMYNEIDEQFRFQYVNKQFKCTE